MNKPGAQPHQAEGPAWPEWKVAAAGLWPILVLAFYLRAALRVLLPLLLR
jgi:hypothetical protein